MATGDKIVIPAQAAGFVSLFGKITKGNGDTINLPEGMSNIGGNGFGYLLDSKANWSPVANSDGSFSSLSLGDDIRIYAVQHASGVAEYVASKNSTVPTGYTAGNSRKLGGFHYGRVRPIANRYDTAFNPPVQIVPNSVWDLGHRPTCDPTGMVEVVPGYLWADIYLNSEGVGVWPENIPVSRFGTTPIKDDVYARADFHQLAGNAGKRIPTVVEFLRYAEGALQGSNSNNDYAWSATSNTGVATAGTVAKALSQYNVVDAAGNLWDWLDDHLDIGTTYAWTTTAVDVGKDATIPRGAVDQADWRCFVGGGLFYGGTRCGARCLSSYASPWRAGGGVGLRCVCDAL